jgi:hypothetical protein
LKNDLSPHEPINKAAMTRLQTEVDRLYGLFVDHVAAMRGMDTKAIRATEAGLFFGPDAVRSGLADALASPAQAMTEFSAYLSVQRIQKSAARVISTTASAMTTTCISNQKEIHMNQDPVSNPVPSNPVAPVDTTLDDEGKPKVLPAPVVPAAPAAPPTPVSPVQVDPAVANDAISAASHAAGLAARAEALTIAELCQLAGQNQRITGFLAQGISSAQVRQTLLASRAQSEEISSVIHPDAALKANPGHANDAGALMAAVKRLTQKP